MKSVGQAIPHESAVGHVTGTAAYIEDLPATRGELHVAFAGSPVAAGRITRIDTAAAAAMPGVAGCWTAEDLTGPNVFGPIFHDEPFLANAELSYLGQPVVVVAADTRERAEAAAGRVVIEAEKTRAIFEIEEALAAGRTLGPVRVIERGDLAEAFATAPHVLEGTFENGGQEQFYLESQACLASVDELGRVHVHSSTQNPTETQAVVAEAFGLGMHEVVCECRRMGGGFGGKETQSAIPAVMAALVARKTGRRARIVYGKSLDMLVTGKRHAYRSKWRAAFDDDGRLLGLAIDFDSNGGAFADLSTSIMERTMLHADNAYFLPACRFVGRIARTNLPPNTAFRGFGGPQGVIVIESVLDAVAEATGLDGFEVRKKNRYVDGDPGRSLAPYGAVVKDHVLEELFDTLEASSEYRARRAEAEAFNATSRTHLRGVGVSALKFGISFTTKFLNQGNALVNVFCDGTVQLSTGGTEMGQGLFTKARQVVADAFGIHHEAVRVMTTSTEKNHNTSPTAASAGSDLNNAAALNACEQILARMRTFAATLFASERCGRVRSEEHVVIADGRVFDSRVPIDGDEAEFGTHALSFAAFCDAARRERVDLGARGFFATPGVDFNRETGRGNPFYYHTTGAAVAGVTVDRFTGEVSVERVDLLMDVGRMINPGIDTGQVIGGFVQGMGWCTTEELTYEDGRLTSHSPTTYKIPASTDVPRDFRFAFLANPKHRTNVRQSKAVGEPPLMLAPCVWLAIRHAVGFVGDGAALRLPATGEEVLRCLSLPPRERTEGIRRGFLPEDAPAAESWTGAPGGEPARR